MRSRLVLAALVIFGALPGFGQAKAPAKAATSSAKAKVYVYRYKSFESKGVRPSIYVDEKDIARVQDGRAVVLAISPGKHMFRSNDKQSVVDLEVKGGQSYYIRIDIATGFLKGHGRLTLVAPEQGASEYKRTKPVDKGMIKDSSALAPGFTPA
jgi:hypothetical protein